MESGEGKMKQSRVYAEIDLGAIRYNMESMHHNLKEGTKMAAVIKADAYGHGACEIAEVIEELPYLWGFAVATVEEAEALIADGRRKPILILGISFEEQYERIIRQEIRPAVCELETARRLSQLAGEMGKQCFIHIKIDTGMSRIGFQATEESAKIIAQIAALPNIVIEGVFTHFARADEIDKGPACEQMERFVWMTERLKELGVSIPIRHCSNSAGIIEIPQANMDMVRAGITLYGLWPSE